MDAKTYQYNFLQKMKYAMHVSSFSYMSLHYLNVPAEIIHFSPKHNHTNKNNYIRDANISINTFNLSPQHTFLKQI